MIIIKLYNLGKTPFEIGSECISRKMILSHLETPGFASGRARDGNLGIWFYKLSHGIWDRVGKVRVFSPLWSLI